MGGIWDWLKGTTPAQPGANYARQCYLTAGPGYNTPAAFAAIDENNVIAMLAHFGTLDYRLLKVSFLTSASGTWTPANGCRAIFVEGVGGGGQGGGAATSSSSASVGGGGGGGGYAGSWITGITTTIAYVCGAGGSGAAAGATGNPGADSTWNTTTVVAKGGTGGAALAAGTSFVRQAGGAGGVAGTGDVSIVGGQGSCGIRLSATQGWSGAGGVAPGFIGGVGSADSVLVVAGGVVGEAANSGQYGAGGSGAATTTTTQAGGAGARGAWRVWEFG